MRTPIFGIVALVRRYVNIKFEVCAEGNMKERDYAQAGLSASVVLRSIREDTHVLLRKRRTNARELK